MSSALNPAPRSRWLTGNGYSTILDFLSLHHPAMWRVRADLLVLYGAIMLVFAFGRFAMTMAMGDENPAIGGRILDVAEGSVVAGSVGFVFFWAFLILRYERLRQEPGFRDRPSFTTLFLCIGWFVIWPIVIFVICVTGDIRPNAPAIPVGDELVNMLLGGCAVFGICIGIVALVIKIILLSSVMRMLGSLALALGTSAGILGIWLAVVIGNRLVLEPWFPDADRWFSNGPPLLPFLSGSIITVITIWTVSRLMLKGVRLVRSIVLALATVACGSFCAGCAVIVLHGCIIRYPSLSILGYQPSKSLFTAILCITLIVCYGIPHLLSIGGDLVRGERSRLTSPVILACLWSVPIYLLVGTYAGLTSLMPNGIAGISQNALNPFFGALAGILAIAAIELLCRTAVRISFLPEP